MGELISKIVLCSSVRIDYLSHAKSCAERLGTEVGEVFFLSEADYRRAARRRGHPRVWLRFQLYVGYPLLLFVSLLTAERGSLYIVTTNTFYAPLLAALFGRLRGIKVVCLLYDLFPDAMIVAGKTNRGSLVAKLSAALQRSSQKKCVGTVYLGELLRSHCEKLYGSPAASEVIDVSADSGLFSDKFKASVSPLVFHYGGQIGHMHDADTVICSIKDCWSNSEIKESARFSFFVSGAQSGFVGKSFTGSGVEVVPAVDSKEWRKRISDFHVGLVTLKPGGATVCLPSKSYSMMAGGLAILAICPRWSDLGKMIIENDVGWVISNSPYEQVPDFDDPDYLEKIEEKRPAEDVSEEFQRQVRAIIDDPVALDKKRQNAFAVMRDKFGRDELGKKWASLIEKVS